MPSTLYIVPAFGTKRIYLSSVDYIIYYRIKDAVRQSFGKTKFSLCSALAFHYICRI